MPRLTLTGLTLYPIKSAAGIRVSHWEVDAFGLQHDRRWMVVDSAGNFLTQRSHPRLALVHPSTRDGALRVEAPDVPALELPLHPSSPVRTSVVVWRDRCDALWLGERPAEWFSRVLGCDCSLVYMPDDSVRPTDPIVTPRSVPSARVSFADGFPFLLISQESLDDLNGRLTTPLPMNRFRPNLVIAGGHPFVEDELRSFQIAGIRFEVVKPCDRCAITTTDQETARRGKEPLHTLATYRRRGSAVFFGQNVVHQGRGRLSVRDPLLV
ncbi:MAG: MOSC domain-containing protein [Gemmatimonadales bacterium]